jgi:glutamate-5-semialdehyde dehydrogenase
MKSIESQCQAAYDASDTLAALSSVKKNKALKAMAQAILDRTDEIIGANKKDLKNGAAIGMSKALLDRLTLTPERMAGVSASILDIEALKDPIGEILTKWTLPNGLKISKIRVPLGVIGIIYEARPNVTVGAIALSIKTGNAVVLRGSASAYESNKALSNILRDAAEKEGVPGDTIQLLENLTHEGVITFVQMKDTLSLVIPRGGAALIQNVVQNATVPSIETGVGNCHVYVDKDADLKKAGTIVINAKTHRPSVCNACESLLVHADIADVFLPPLLKDLNDMGVEIRGCEKTKALFPAALLAEESDWDEEYLDLILAVKIVASLDDALAHLKKHSSHHSEAIISENDGHISRFIESVDAAVVLVNTSTRFTDGGEFGFGAEMGISTQKIHARGPLGLPELTTYKYIVQGNGQIRT